MSGKYTYEMHPILEALLLFITIGVFTMGYAILLSFTWKPIEEKDSSAKQEVITCCPENYKE